VSGWIFPISAATDAGRRISRNWGKSGLTPFVYVGGTLEKALIRDIAI